MGLGRILRKVQATRLYERLWNMGGGEEKKIQSTPIVCLSTWVDGQDKEKRIGHRGQCKSRVLLDILGYRLSSRDVDKVTRCTNPELCDMVTDLEGKSIEKIFCPWD